MKGPLIRETDAGNEVRDGRSGAQREKHASEDGDAFKSRRSGAGNKRIGDYQNKGKDE